MTSFSASSIGWRLKFTLAALCLAASPVVHGQQGDAGEESAPETTGQASVLAASEAREQLKALLERQKPVYEVEMLIFENLEVPGLSMQKWPEKTLIPSLDGLTAMPPDVHVRDPEPSAEEASASLAREQAGNFLGGRRSRSTPPRETTAPGKTPTATLGAGSPENASLTETIEASAPETTTTLTLDQEAADDSREISLLLTDAEIDFSRLHVTLTWMRPCSPCSEAN